MKAEHNAGSRVGPRRRIMRSLKINEISAVDVPAQEGAVAVIMKRRDPAKKPEKQARVPDPQTEELDFEKGAALTTENAGNTHLVGLTGHTGDEVNSGMTSWVDEHSHPWIRNVEDEIVIGAAPASNGEVHSHQIAEMSKGAEADGEEDAEKRTFSAKERERLARTGEALPDGSFPVVTRADLKNAISAFGRAGNKAQVARHIKKRAKALKATDLLPTEGPLADLLKNTAQENDIMSDNKDQKTDGNEKAVEELKKQLVRANSVADLNDAERKVFGTLKGDEADAYLAKPADERKADIEKAAKEAEAKAKDNDPVVYTTEDGLELRKSMGEAFVNMAKSNDSIRKENKVLREGREQDALEKRAETELSHLPGDLKTRAAMLKAIDGIEDEEQRKAALDSLRAQDAKLSAAFETAGHGGTPEPGSADDELNKLAQEHKDKNPELTIEQAHAEVLKTERGGELYTKTLN